MTEQERLEAVHQGIAFPKDRGLLPGKCGWIPMSRDQFIQKTQPSELDYVSIDQMVTDGVARFTEYNDFVMLIPTYEGRRRLFELTKWDRTQWAQSYSTYICCEKALPSFCVCIVRTCCPDHGDNCHGTHD